MLNYKYKKGFTLIELIIVIAIIAILASIAIPTTLHYVEEAHESNDQQLIDISENVKNYINLAAAKNDYGNFIKEENINSFIKMIEDDIGTVESRKYINDITLSFEKVGSSSYSIYCEIKGKKESKNVQTVKREVIAEIDASKIFNGIDSNQIPNSIIFVLINGNINEYNIELG